MYHAYIFMYTHTQCTIKSGHSQFSTIRLFLTTTTTTTTTTTISHSIHGWIILFQTFKQWNGKLVKACGKSWNRTEERNKFILIFLDDKLNYSEFKLEHVIPCCNFSSKPNFITKKPKTNGHDIGYFYITTAKHPDIHATLIKALVSWHSPFF